MSEELLVFRVSEDEGNTDFLFLTLEQALSVGRRLVARRRSDGGYTWLEQAPMPIPSIEEGGKEILEIIPQDVDSSQSILTPSPRLSETIAQLARASGWTSTHGWTAFHGYDRFRTSLQLKEAGSDPLIIVNNNALNWIPGAAGWAEFRTLIDDPTAFGGTLIGGGSEGIVYSVRWAGRDCALKLFNPVAQARLQKLGENPNFGPRVFFQEPNFVHRVGFLERVMGVVRDLPDLPIDLTGAQEFATGIHFQLTELVPGLDLSKLRPRRWNQPLPPSGQAVSFIQQYNITDEELDQIEGLLAFLTNVIEMVRQTRAIALRDRTQVHTLVPGNLIIRGRDPVTRRLQATLIDQGETLPHIQDSNAVMDDSGREERHAIALQTFEELSRVPGYNRFLERHVPNGVPNKPF